MLFHCHTFYFSYYEWSCRYSHLSFVVLFPTCVSFSCMSFVHFSVGLFDFFLWIVGVHYSTNFYWMLNCGWHYPRQWKHRHERKQTLFSWSLHSSGRKQKLKWIMYNVLFKFLFEKSHECILDIKPLLVIYVTNNFSHSMPWILNFYGVL